MRSLLLALLINVTPIYIIGQQKANFISPLDIPLLLSGNFGELRSNHFHSGLDFKTQGISGHNVYAVESGYVSRINIQPGGYGKALYIDHPNGFTTVYGHVSRFSPEIENYIKEIQYKRKSHTVNIYLKPGELIVSKGEVVALSGNTGSSSGPHLHFEIRRTAGQIPLNGLFYGFPISDNIPPKITKLAVYPAGESSHVQNSDAPKILIPDQGAQGYTISNGEPIRVYGKIGFGIEVFDYLNGAANRCGVYSIELLLDGKRCFYSEMNEFSFGESRFINAHIDYARKYQSRSSIQRLYKLPYNELSIYKQLENDGLIDILDTVTREIKIIVTDSYDNTSVLKFPVRGTGVQPLMKANKSFSGKILPYNAPSSFSDRNIKLSFPGYCFYEDVHFSYTRTNGKQGLLSDVFHLHDASTPVHKSFGIDISMSETPEKYHDQLCIVKIQDDGSLTYAGGKYNNGVLSESLREFGRYAVAVDTISPSIRPLNLQHGGDLSQLPGIRFLIEDDFSGIKTYNGYLDGEWILFEYDPKNNLLLHEFDDRVPILGKNRDLELHIEDAKGNRSIYSMTFFR
jgi:murein DD-endopeptidase MepM/ murein hydrolase activator NlpD